jgi:hypothetical protein
MLAGLTDGLGWIKPIVLIMDDRATSKKMAYRRDQGTARPKSTEDAVAAGEPRRIDVLIASDRNVRDEMIDEPCIHVASNGTARTKAVFLDQVATWKVSLVREKITQAALPNMRLREQGHPRLIPA